jgi:hypothetical protein
MKKVLVIVTILVSILSISGCKWQFLMPRVAPLSFGGTYDVNVSVGPDGAKHYFWVACSSGYCYLTYIKTFTGKQVVAIVYDTAGPWEPYTPSYRYPDSAVTDDGTVYFVWHAMDVNGDYLDCWNHIHADGSIDDNLCHPLYMPEFYTSPYLSHPKVIAYENVAYAVFERLESGNRTLWYQQLNPLNASYGIVSNYDPDGGSSMDPSLAVSEYLDGAVTKYVLHVAWANNSGGASSKTVYNDNYGLIGDMTHQKLTSDTGIRSNPVVVTTDGPNKMVYVTYRQGTSGSSCLLRLMNCSLPDCAVMSYYIDGLLDSTDHYWLVGTPDMAAMSNDAIFITFLGMNDATRLTTNYQEVFSLTYSDAISVPVTPTRITMNDLKESDPRIALTLPGISIAWRLNPGSGIYRDVYILDNYSSSIRTVFTSPADVLDGFFDMASRGADVGGIFIDQRSTINTQYGPWISMNVESKYFPVLIKP